MTHEQLVNRALEALSLKGRGKYKVLANKLGITDRALRYFRKAPSDKYTGLEARIKSLILEQKKHVVIVTKQSSVAVGYYISVLGDDAVQTIYNRMRSGSQDILFFDSITKITPKYISRMVKLVDIIEENEECEFVNKFRWIASMVPTISKNWQARVIETLPVEYQVFGEL